MRARWMGVLWTAGVVLVSGLVCVLLGHYLTAQSLKSKGLAQEFLGFALVTLLVTLPLAVLVKLFSRSFSYGRLLRWCMTLLIGVEVLSLVKPVYLFYFDRPVFGLLGAGVIVLVVCFYLYRLSAIAFPQAAGRPRKLGVGILVVAALGCWQLVRYSQKDEDPHFDMEGAVILPLRSYGGGHPPERLLQDMRESRARVDALRIERQKAR